MSNPSISLPTVASLLSTTATLGATITSAGTASLTAAGIVLSLTSVNAAPAIGGGGVTNIVHAAPTVAAFTEAAASLTPGALYTFAGYATNANGTTYTGFATFTAAALLSFLSCTSTNTEGESIYIRLHTGKRDRIDNVLSIAAIGQPWLNSTYRDLFDGMGYQPADGSGRTAFVTTQLGTGAGFPPTASTPVSLSDEIAHTPPRQGQWIEGGVMFTTTTGLQFPWFWKDMAGFTNAPTVDGPTNVTS